MFSQQTADLEKATEEVEPVPAVIAAPVAAPVASVAPPKSEPAKNEMDDLTEFREKVCRC